MAAEKCGASRRDGYLPIREYGLIGDCHGSALVGRDGSIDWCCLGRFDAEPVFCRILDSNRGGFISVTPLQDASTRRAYLDDTNVLQTVFTSAEGELVVTDFMPVGRRPGSGTHDYVELVAPNWLVRIVEVTHGAMPLSIQYRPSVQFGREPARLTLEENGIAAERGPFLLHNISGFVLSGDLAAAAWLDAAGRIRK